MANLKLKSLFSSTGQIGFLFFISGFAAILYQIVWQKVLFTSYGVNIQSVTIVVAIFMLGLGTGSLFGGALSRRFPDHLPYLFFLCEFAAGAFGIFSVVLIKYVSILTIQGSLFQISLAIASLLFIPTLFMGATLPILVDYLDKTYRNIGKSVGLLYFTNTIGSSVACFIISKFLLSNYGIQTTVWIAACLNFLVGSLVFLYSRKRRNEAVIPANATIITNPFAIHYLTALLLSFVIGYISLSQEILWFRIISYATGGLPKAFAFVLCLFLLGIALSSLVANKICERGKINPLLVIATMLLCSSLIFYYSFPLNGYLLSISKFKGYGPYALILVMSLLIVLTSFSLGGIFPLLCHLGIHSHKAVGASISWLYFSNVIGSTLGPLLTGFVLLNYFSLETTVLLIFILTLSLSFILFFRLVVKKVVRGFALAGLPLAAFIVVFFHQDAYAHLWEKLHLKHKYTGASYKYIVQNRNGVIAVLDKGVNDNIVYGGGVFDGKYNIDPVRNSNGIFRAYMIPCLHPDLDEVMEIGFASGSWARVAADFPGMNHLSIVEINPGYLELIKNYPDIASVVSDPRVHIYIDDGRRWLNRNPDKKFNFIIMNDSFYWREGSTNLLSSDFLRIIKSHLKPGGVLYYNTTDCEDIVYTASQVFNNVVRIESFIAASDAPFVMDSLKRKETLLKFTHEGKPVFNPNDSLSNNVINRLCNYPFHDIGNEYRAKNDLWEITDDNLATEYKRVHEVSIKKTSAKGLDWVKEYGF